MSKQNESKSGSIGLLGMLGIVFVTLKLTGVINWSWWWVTIPFWGGIALMVVILLIYILVIGIREVIKK